MFYVAKVELVDSFLLPCLLITLTDAELRYCANIAILNQLVLKIIWVDATLN